MGIRQFKPVTPGTRFRIISDFEEITKKAPEESLLEPLRSQGGRNNQGHVTTRYRGGGHKRMYRRVDFRRDKFGIPGKVAAIEYDPNRSARLALIQYSDGEKRYILHPRGLAVGDAVAAGPGADIRLGNAVPLAVARGVGVIAMKTLCRGQLPQMAEEPDQLVRELLAYTLCQSVTLAVVGADSVKQVEQLAAAVRDFAPMTPEEQLRLEEAVAPYARQLMYYKP